MFVILLLLATSEINHGLYNLSTIKNCGITIIPRSKDMKNIMRSKSLGHESDDLPFKFEMQKQILNQTNPTRI